jgi:HlyD family secretion protein
MLTAIARRWLYRGAVSLVIVGLGFWGWRYFSAVKPLEVSVAEVGYGRVESTIANTRAGTVKACRRAKLSPQGGGQISRLLVREGDHVKAGQTLIELWNHDLAAQLKLAEEQVRAARAHHKEACVANEAAQREANRNKLLLAQGFVSPAALDKVESDADVRAATCKAAESEISAAVARVETARANLSRTVLVAPFAGIVAEVTGEQGEYSTPSPPGIPTPPAIDLIDDSCLFVNAPVDEVDAPKLRVGLPARIALDAFPNRHFPGRVKRIAPYVLEVEKQARTVDVEVSLDEAQSGGGLLAGYSADAEVILDAHDNVLRLPTQALMEGNRVLVLHNGKLEERKLDIGLSNWEFSEVTHGLSKGDKVVTSLSVEGIKAGVPAIIKTSTKTATTTKP